MSFKSYLDGPGYDLPVYPGELVLQYDPALIVIFAWRYADPIVSKQAEYIAHGGRFIVPLPDISVVR